MRSMTGFGVGGAPLGAGRVTVEIHGVNARFLDVRVRMPRELGDSTLAVEQSVRAKLIRGRFEVLVRTDGNIVGSPELDTARARSAWRALLALRDELAPGTEVPLSMLTAVPDLFASPLDKRLDAVGEALEAATTKAVAALDAMRLHEGRALADDLSARIAVLSTVVKKVADRVPQAVEQNHARLLDRIGRLLGGEPRGVDAGRLELEVALIADRTDVAEELTRLRSHLLQFQAYLASAEPQGRRLDFLLQEMGREVNTIGSKCQDATIAREVVEAKAELERMREQVQNVE